MTAIRHFQPQDWASLWPLLRSTFATGDTYAYAPDAPEAAIHAAWVEQPLATYVACADDGTLLGSYTLKPNQPGLGGHVCNCGYVVAPAARGRGLASAMCEHSQAEARRLGFRAMQFNLVVSTNEGAVRLWQKLGFRIVGTLPGAFQHQRHGDVDAYVMFKPLKG
ncbi:GNAT family N-acetyltransferase [Xylophilus sp. ASV27]|uniref:GNAT family N-acetyltransferase n=1 Tax=Xylophilus sp. ASV27 TaxID=2795129 RepID=UPI0018EC96AC|nr:N-acetyltransferase [Xylophilus sp. ASV27]